MCKSKYWDLKTAVDATGWASGRSLPLQPSKPHPFADGGDNDGGDDDASKGDDDDDYGGRPPSHQFSGATPNPSALRDSGETLKKENFWRANCSFNLSGNVFVSKLLEY